MDPDFYEMSESMGLKKYGFWGSQLYMVLHILLPFWKSLLDPAPVAHKNVCWLQIFQHNLILYSIQDFLIILPPSQPQTSGLMAQNQWAGTQMPTQTIGSGLIESQTFLIKQVDWFMSSCFLCLLYLR